MYAKRFPKLKRLLASVPPGYLVDARWLTAEGFARESFRDYVKEGWLERVTRGVFRTPVSGSGASAETDWRICVLSLQRVMAYSVHVGGTTALHVHGHSHYLSLSKQPTVWLYGNAPPTWLHRVPLNAEFHTRRTSLFSLPELGVSTKQSELRAHAGQSPSDWTMRTSSRERACLEAIDELPIRESFHALDVIFEGLSNLRPRLLAELLLDCRKIKVKRLFFVFADRHGHAWNRHLDARDFDLGKGDRALVKGGRIHPRYRIMVPEEFAAVSPDAQDVT